jgi:2-polyprenyl-6-methoxyphenol hydroxylase-like FAD-dependent oxidoreductase
MTDVLIIGAGPTGLLLALWLARLGVKPRIIDKAAVAGTTSRALAVQARTLELYRQLGLAEEIVARGLRFEAINLWVAGRSTARVPLGEMGTGLSPYPFVLTFPQDEHERFLIDRLAAAGVTVERNTELVGFTTADGVTSAQLKRAGGGEETVQARYLAGCDGARSRVREGLGGSFSGTTYQHLFYVADVEASGPVMNGELHVALDEVDLLAVFPLRGAGRARLIGVVRPESEEKGEGLRWEDVSRGPLDRLQIAVAKVNWFSTYHVHHRVAEHFRRGPVFLAGDAAHIHSPVGGQGMNTGLGDAVNLAWKLAAVVQGRASDALLDSYEPERIAFARRLVATTDQAFRLATSTGPLAAPVRTRLFPRLVPPLFHLTRTRKLMFRTVSQINVNYRRGPLSAGRAGKVAGGDRLPWIPHDGGDNFAPLAALRWQVHVHGAASPVLAEGCRSRNLTLHVFPWSPAADAAGVARDAAYLVRPDGYVALAARHASVEEIGAHLDRLTVRP